MRKSPEPRRGVGSGPVEPPPGVPLRVPQSLDGHPIFAKDLFISFTSPSSAHTPSISLRRRRSARLALALRAAQRGAEGVDSNVGPVRSPAPSPLGSAASSGWREGQPAPRPSCPLLCVSLQPLPLRPPAVERRREGRGEGGARGCLQPGRGPR